MRRIVSVLNQILALSAMLLLLGSCGRVVVPPVVATGAPPPHPTGFAPRLLRSYFTVDVAPLDDGRLLHSASYRGVSYHPGAATFAGYEGWDELDLPRSQDAVRDWLHVTLNRPARVVVLWKDEAAWLGAWRRLPDVGSFHAWYRDVPAGDLTFGAPGAQNEAYTVILGETGGVAPSEPPLPTGVSESDRPRPNEPCPDWLHAAYQAKGPDGVLYESYHPQIDPVYWCSFGHEHGSDPSLVHYRPAYRYVADHNYLQPEQHEGFKGYAIPGVTSEDGHVYDWFVSIHSTTSNLHRACARHHTVVIAVMDAGTGTLAAQLSFKGDFGATRSNQSDHRVLQPTFHHDCPKQQPIAEATDADKRLRIANQPGVDAGGYESWRGALNPTLGISVPWGQAITLDIRDPMTACDTYACAGAISTGQTGTRRSIAFHGLHIRYATDSVRLLDGADGSADGVFYTDPYGHDARSAGAADAMWQYVRPGLDASIDGFFGTEDAWRGLYVQDLHPQSTELESSLQAN